MIHAVRSTDVLDVTLEKKRRLSESGTTMTTSTGSGSGDEGDSMEIAPSAAAGPSRPVIKRSNSLGHSSTFLLDGSSPIITSFYSPTHSDYQFKKFYERLKEQGFVIYPGKVSNADCFRIGNIGEVYPSDIEALICAVENAMYWDIK